MLKSDVADLANASGFADGRCVTAALFLSASFPKDIALGAFRHLCLARRRPSPAGPRAATRWACGRHSPCSESSFRSRLKPFSSGADEIRIFRIFRLQHFGVLTGFPWNYATMNGEDRMSGVSLSGWMKALIAYVRSGEPDLTNRQMALLMLVYLTPGPAHGARPGRMLGVSKPVVTRALNTLGALGYLRRERDQDDRRNVFVVRTSNGAEFLEGFKRNLREATTSSAAHRQIIGQAPAYASPALTVSRCRAFRPAGPRFPRLPQGPRRRRARGRVIASHYAEPVDRHLTTRRCALAPAPRIAASELAGRAVRDARYSLGWAWGYARRGPARRLRPGSDAVADSEQRHHPVVEAAARASPPRRPGWALAGSTEASIAERRRSRVDGESERARV